MIPLFCKGRDATRLLVSEDAVKETEEELYALDGLSSTQISELGDWLKMYARKYRCVGHLPGIYFSPMGDPSDYLLRLFETWNTQPLEGLHSTEKLPECAQFSEGNMLMLTCASYKT